MNLFDGASIWSTVKFGPYFFYVNVRAINCFNESAMFAFQYLCSFIVIEICCFFILLEVPIKLTGIPIKKKRYQIFLAQIKSNLRQIKHGIY